MRTPTSRELVEYGPLGGTTPRPVLAYALCSHVRATAEDTGTPGTQHQARSRQTTATRAATVCAYMAWENCNSNATATRLHERITWVRSGFPLAAMLSYASPHTHGC